MCEIRIVGICANNKGISIQNYVPIKGMLLDKIVSTKGWVYQIHPY